MCAKSIPKNPEQARAFASGQFRQSLQETMDNGIALGRLASHQALVEWPAQDRQKCGHWLLTAYCRKTHWNSMECLIAWPQSSPDGSHARPFRQRSVHLQSSQRGCKRLWRQAQRFRLAVMGGDQQIDKRLDASGAFHRKAGFRSPSSSSSPECPPAFRRRATMPWGLRPCAPASPASSGARCRASARLTSTALCGAFHALSRRESFPAGSLLPDPFHPAY